MSKNSKSLPKPVPIRCISLAVLLIACIIASIHPLDMTAYLLHQSGTVVGIIALLYLCHKCVISTSAYLFAIIFLLLHVVGAHYLYSYVPYNQWAIQLFGFDINHFFGWDRNMYDRLIHFCYGLLLFKLFIDVFSNYFPGSRPSYMALLAIQFVMASSMVYELIEWAVAIIMSPEQAENYNGQQGDDWDSQKDMATAALGSIIAWLIYRFTKRD